MVKRNSSKPSHKKNKMSTGGKRQPSGYLIFCSEQRVHQKTEFEKMKAKEIMQHLGAEWRKLSPQQQEAYKAKAPTKAHHDVSHKEDSKPHNKTAHHGTNTKMKSSIKRQARSKSVPKKKGHAKKAKKTHRKTAHHHHETGISSSE
jgi:hypothetical protein